MSHAVSARAPAWPARAVTRALPWPVVALVLALAMPSETSIWLGPLRLSPYRVLLLVLFVPALARLFTGRAGKIQAVDHFMMLHTAWVALALMVTEGVAQGIESGGIYVVECLGAYLVARCWIRSAADFEALCRLMFLTVAVMLLFTLPETVTGSHMLRDLFRAVLGGPPLPYIEPRLGLTRAFGSFDHPIHYGVFCASTVALTYYMVGRARLGPRALASNLAVGLATFLSLSSGALVALGIQAMLIGWDRFTRAINGRWIILAVLFASMWTVLGLLSNRSPIKVFISYMTFSAHSAYNRILIWEYGSAEVGRHPLFGIGFGDWARPEWMHSSSMDNFWLVTAVRYGLPALVVLLGSIVVMVVRLAQLKKPDPMVARARAAWMITLGGLSLAAVTVHLWNALLILFVFLIGTGVWMLDARARSLASIATRRFRHASHGRGALPQSTP